jgi:hypothetical protein
VRDASADCSTSARFCGAASARRTSFRPESSSAGPAGGSDVVVELVLDVEVELDVELEVDVLVLVVVLLEVLELVLVDVELLVVVELLVLDVVLLTGALELDDDVVVVVVVAQSRKNWNAMSPASWMSNALAAATRNRPPAPSLARS